RSASRVGEELPKYPMRTVCPVCCALYSCALAVAPSGVNAMTTPVVKRRRDIIARPPVRRRGSSPAETTAGEKRERRPKHEGHELADQRTLLRRALGGSRRTVPVGTRTAPEVQEKVAPQRAGIRPTSPFALLGPAGKAPKEEDECAITSE